MPNMNQSLMVCLVVACMAVWVHAIICPENLCDTIQCHDDNITEESCNAIGEVFKKNGGFCGCCNICVKILAAGAPCIIFQGSPPTYICETGTDCINRTCQQPPENNQYQNV